MTHHSRAKLLVLGLVFWLLQLPSAVASDFPTFTELVKKNSPAVVNISTTQKIEARRTPEIPENLFPDLPEGSPFGEFFKRFFEEGPSVPEERQMQSLGSGFIISSDGYILTSTHVIKDADEIVVRLNDHREKPAEVVGTDERSDVALLKIDATDLPSVELGDSDDLQVGEWVLAIGSPFGLELTATQGIVSALGRNLPSDTYVPFIQTDVAVNPGNSGGPLFNTNGQVVGINAQIYTRTGGYMGLSFAIPIRVAMQVSDQLKTQGYVTRGWLGVVIQPVTQDLAQSFGLDRPRGALVTRIVPDSPAAKADLKTGDIILKYGTTPIERSGELPPLVGSTQIGTVVPLQILREGQIRDVKIEIEALVEDRPAVRAEGEKTGHLNMVVAELPSDKREELDIGDRGILIKEVVEGPAADAGIGPGDILLMINGRDVTSVPQFVSLVKDIPQGKPVPVLVLRGENPLFLALTIPKN
ncbi:MAG: DegQ family serine endoprotease [Gammaproteobacteria bacterium]|jgi:serine protease Do